MYKYYKRGTYSEIAEARYNQELELPFVGYDAVEGKVYYSQLLPTEAAYTFECEYTIAAMCQDNAEEQNEAKGGMKALVFYDNYFNSYCFGNSEEPGAVVEIKVPECADQGDGWYQLHTLKEVYIDGNQIEIYVDNGEGGYDSFDEFYFDDWSFYKNIKLTLTTIEVPEQPQRSMKGETKTGEPETQDVWVLTFEEKNYE